VVERRAHPWGIMNLPAVGHGEDAHAPYRAALEAACGDWLKAAPAGALIAAGMVGSKQGWREAAYLNVPLAPPDRQPADRGRYRPGPSAVDRAGPAAGLDPAQRDARRGNPGHRRLQTRTERELLIGLPGTHSKWVRVVDGRIEHFDTFMTGEVYAPCAPTPSSVAPCKSRRPPMTPPSCAARRGAGARARAACSPTSSAAALGLTGELAADAQPDYLGPADRPRTPP
jgi:2-dehydro-3-deoxygalactonokinase